MEYQVKKYKPEGAKIFGAIVYVGVVLAATTLYISFVLTAFPVNAYFSRIVMVLAGLLVGASMVAFPIALHSWMVEKRHRLIATGLYYGEMVLIMVNTVVSFMKLLSVNTGYAMSEWAILYEPLSIGSIIYTLFAWGTVFLSDPEHNRTQMEREADDRFFRKLASKQLDFVDSQAGEDLVLQIATARAYDKYHPDNFKGGAKAWGTGIPASAPFIKKEAKTSSPLLESDDD